MWPELKIVHGKPRHSQSQGRVKFLQFMKNRAFHSGIKRSPYRSMFGGPTKVGITSSIIPQEIFHSLHKEEDLEKLDDVDIDVSENTPLQSSLIETIEVSNIESVQDQQDEITETLTNSTEPFQSQSTDHQVMKDFQETHMDNKSSLTNELTKDNSDDTVVQDPAISDQLPSENQ
ncbi:unnamed protein product [Euphydryas editha]|uniref:Uncharacterized protein n=1 Tax=Euphydryas editha TaxID=104508 RepID=A0AAU9TTE9_EUPED|nr:unnamed protein product [Euphydryas editha]